MPLSRKPTAPPRPHSGAPAPDDILRGLQSTSPDERWSAARAAIGIAGGPAAVAAAVRVETEPHVRDAMFTSLARTGSEASTTELLGLLRSDESTLRTGALDALRSSAIAAATVLPRLIRDADADVRMLSCELARALPTPDATALLCALLADEPQANVCAAAVEVLAEVGSAAAIPVLAQCAVRFPQDPFLGFAITVATDRITSLSAPARD